MAGITRTPFAPMLSNSPLIIGTDARIEGTVRTEENVNLSLHTFTCFH
jgi:hypothetical protein